MRGFQARRLVVLTLAVLGLAAPDAMADSESQQDESASCSPEITWQTAGDFVGGDCPQLIVATAETESIRTGDGDDVIIGGDDVETINGGGGDDTIFANGTGLVAGGDGDDLLFGDGLPEEPDTYGDAPPEGAEAAEALEDALQPFVEELGEQAVDRALAIAEAGGELASYDPAYGAVTIMALNEINGTPNNDNLSGGSGNDLIRGYGGDDRLFGNIGDDELYGGGGNDLLSGGQGGDDLDGEAGNDMLRGDGTVDRIRDTGGGTDTISFASAVTPGFSRNVPGPDGPPNGYINFPSDANFRGVYIDLTNDISDNGMAEDGGGVDDGSGNNLNGIENIIGSPFADYIVGDSGANVIDGGGGPDVILGMGGNDTIYGNAGHDNISGGAGTNTVNGGPGVDYCQQGTETSCNEPWSGPTHVIQRDLSKVAVGMLTRPAVDHTDFYLVGGTANEEVNVTYDRNTGSADVVTFWLPSGTFDTSESEMTSNCDYTYANPNATYPRVICSSNDRIGTVLVAGMGGHDNLFGPYNNMPRQTTYMGLGGNDNDWIQGTNTSDDLLVDGPGNDTLQGFGLDDGLINKGGADKIWAGDGDDLVLTVRLCEGSGSNGDELSGGAGTDNASWAKLPSSFGGVAARLEEGKFGFKSSSGPTCSGQPGPVGTLAGFENLEGTEQADGLFGDDGANHLLGRPGNDSLYSRGGNDVITARDGEADSVVDCGAGASDTAILDGTGLDPNSIVSNCENKNRP